MGERLGLLQLVIAITILTVVAALVDSGLLTGLLLCLGVLLVLVYLFGALRALNALLRKVLRRSADVLASGGFSLIRDPAVAIERSSDRLAKGKEQSPVLTALASGGFSLLRSPEVAEKHSGPRGHEAR